MSISNITEVRHHTSCTQKETILILIEFGMGRGVSWPLVAQEVAQEGIWESVIISITLLELLRSEQFHINLVWDESMGDLCISPTGRESKCVRCP